MFNFIGVVPIFSGYSKSLFSFNFVLHKSSQKYSLISSPFPSPWGRIGGAALFLSFILNASAQTSVVGELWHNKQRIIHYQPQGNDFVLYKGTRKFNRALYGTNTGFRVEAGDLPEFALYMPGMGGNCKIGISVNGKSKWITVANSNKNYLPPRHNAVSN